MMTPETEPRGVPRRLAILGSTGSIGENALRVAARLRDRIRVAGLAADRNWRRVLAQAGEFGIRRVALRDPEAARACRARAGQGLEVLEGEEGVIRLAADPAADLVLCAVVGMAGLRPVLAALERGADVALATKEVLVSAGAVVSALSRERGGRILPVDSEHSAIFQCLEGRHRRSVRRIVLTASGGPFRGRPELDLERVSVEDALAHPSWSMGPKVSVDSATMMNKGLEIMEAQWLFGTEPENIEVVIHPESIVHSMVEFVDGICLAQLSHADMRFAIQYALTYPHRVAGGLPSLNLAAMGSLTFREPDATKFPCLGLARAAAAAGGTMPAVLNAANETAVNAFLRRRTRFADIWRTVERVMSRHRPVAEPGLEDIMAADGWARRAAEVVS